MRARFKVGLVQLNTQPDAKKNASETLRLIREASELEADLVMTPEMTDFYEPDLHQVHDRSYLISTHPFLAQAQKLAKELGIWLLLGSLNISVKGRVANRSVLIDPNGQKAASYDKIHLFDVDIPDGQHYRESSVYQPGDKAVVVDLPWGKMGMTICYDVRFPHLYRTLAKKGSHFLSVPAAFTEFTGRSHWTTLLRSRAIENGCFVFAPAQCGLHAGNRRTYGHSLVVDPWGDVLAEAGEGPCVVTAEIDPGRVDEVRSMIPSLAAD